MLRPFFAPTGAPAGYPQQVFAGYVCRLVSGADLTECAPLETTQPLRDSDRMHRVLSVVGAALILVLAVTAVAGPPNVPPDIQAILDKKKRHEPLTMDDIKKLQDWAAGVQAHLPTPPLPPGTPGAPATDSASAIPVRFDLSANYTRRSGSTTQTFDITESAPAQLTAKVNGTGDYVKGILDPSAKVSSFLFQTPTGAGTGHYRFHATQSDGTIDFDSKLDHVGAGLMLVTVGGDTLGIIPGQILGSVDSAYRNVINGKTGTEHYTGAVRESLVELLFPWEAHVTKDRTKPTPHPRAQISYRELAAAIQSGKPTQIKVSEHFDWNDHGEQVAGNVQLTITVQPPPTPRLEARIVPDVDWNSWMPEGPTPKREHGNAFPVHIALYDPQSGAPWKGNEKVEGVTFELKEVSHLPGVCTNWPAKGEPEYEEKPDLFFAKSNKHGKAKDDDSQTWELGATEWSQPVTIESRDFAASGQLTAKVQLEGAPPLDAKFEPLQTTYLPIPRDDDHNHISDAWKPGLNLDAAADDENTPGFRAKGDGFTVMEEYRGFLVSPGRQRIPAGDEDLRRLDPNTRELLVVLELSAGKEEALVAQGIHIFETASQVTVYALAEQPRAHRYPGDNGRPRGVVFNVSPPDSKAAADTANTLGVWITSKMLRPDSVARSWPAGDYDKKHCEAHPFDCEHSPATIRYVAIGDLTQSASTVNWMISLVDPDPTPGGDNTQAAKRAIDAYLRKQGITDDQRRKAVAIARKNQPTLSDEMTGFSIGHELGHSLGAQHHGVFSNNPNLDASDGPPNCPMRYWQDYNRALDEYPNTINWLDFFTGKWNPIVSGPTGPWEMCGVNIAEMGYRP